MEEEKKTKALELANCDLDNERAGQLAQYLLSNEGRSVEILDLSENSQLTLSGLQYISAACQTSVQLLNLSVNPFLCLQQGVCAFLGSLLTRLSSLVLSRCELKDPSVITLALSARAGVIKLRSLDLSCNQITPMGVACIVRCCCWVKPMNPQTKNTSKSLSLGDFHDEGIEELDVSWNMLTAEGKGMAAVCRALMTGEAERDDPDYDMEASHKEGLRCSLTGVNLSHNDLRASGVSQLCPFLSVKTLLRNLNLAYTNMGQLGLRALCKNLTLSASRLKELNLSGNNFCLEALSLVPVIANYGCLHRLYLDYTCLSAADGWMLAKAMATNYVMLLFFSNGNIELDSGSLLQVLRISTENAVFHAVDSQMAAHAGGLHFERNIAILITEYLLERDNDFQWRIQFI